MQSRRRERLAFLLLGFAPGVFVGVSAAALYILFANNWIAMDQHGVFPVALADLETPPPENTWLTEETYGSNAIHVPRNQILVVQSDDVLGAIKFTDISVEVGSASGIAWVLRVDDDALNVESERTFQLLERYDEVETSVIDGIVNRQVEDAGGQYHIPIGLLSIEWSSGSWVYFESGVRFALLPERQIEDVTLGQITALIATGEQD